MKPATNKSVWRTKAATWLCALALVGGCNLATLSADAEELAASFKARVNIEGFSGVPLQYARASEPFRIRVQLTDALTGDVVKLPKPPQGWIRPVEESDATCSQAARNFRATGKLPLGSVDLNGIALANLTRELALLYVDPKLDLATSNIMAATQLDDMPSAVLNHPERRSLFFSLGKRGIIQSSNPFLANPVVFASGLSLPGDMVSTPDGGVWVAENGTGKLIRFSASGERLSDKTLSKRALHLRSSGDLLVAFQAPGHAIVLERSTGREITSFKSLQLKELAIADGASTQVMVSLEESAGIAHIRYVDAAENVIAVPLVADATRLAVSNDARWAFAFSPDQRALSIIDIAAGRLVQGLALKAPVAEIVFAGNTAFMRASDSSVVTTLSLASIKQGTNAVVGQIPLGQPDKDPVTANPGLLIPLSPSESVFAVHPPTFTAFVASPMKGMSNSLPPTGVRLRGGLPDLIAVVDRSFSRNSSGEYETGVAVTEPGEYEIVFTTGIQGLTTCVPLSVTGDKSRPLRQVVALKQVETDSPIVAGHNASILFSLVDMQGRQLQTPKKMTLRFTHLGNGWRKSVVGISVQSGVVSVISLPLPGQYMVEALNLPRAWSLRGASQIEVKP